MNDLAKPDLKHGVPLSCIPEVGHRRLMQRKLKFQSSHDDRHVPWART